jgi:hypothetical protein
VVDMDYSPPVGLAGWWGPPRSPGNPWRLGTYLGLWMSTRGDGRSWTGQVWRAIEGGTLAEGRRRGMPTEADACRWCESVARRVATQEANRRALLALADLGFSASLDGDLLSARFDPSPGWHPR